MSKCQIKECNNKYHAKGYCNKHYIRYKKHGDPLFTLKERHGMRWTRTYRSWTSMLSRCTDINSHAYKDYGGRGIKVCNKWKNSFLAFYKDMGERPEDLQLNRINNDGNYAPNNCRWTTVKQNSRNRRSNVLNMEIAQQIRHLYKNGLSIKNISEKLKFKKTTIGSVLYKGCWE